MFAKALTLLLLATLVAAVAVRQSAGGGRPLVYVVRPADTLWAIAATHYAGDPREALFAIQDRNGLHGTLIRPGERLILP